ncbi:MAG: hypothetical protein ABIH00_04955 [Armatimonadota bacterium]
MSAKYKIFILTALFILCFIFYAGICSEKLPENIILGCSDKIVKLKFDPGSKSYIKKTEFLFNKDCLRQVEVCTGHLYVRTVNEILKFNGELTDFTSKSFKKLESLAVNKKGVFVSADASFIAMDKDLKELSRINIEKNAHDILIYNDTAYLLDNIIIPMYVLRVDIKDPSKVYILDKTRISGINAHLDAQWLVPESGLWMILESYAHQGGYGQLINIHLMDDAGKVITRQNIYRRSFYKEELYEETEGFKMLGVSDTRPCFAVCEFYGKIRDLNKKYYICRIKIDDKKIKAEKCLNLDYKNINTKVIIKEKNNFLFVMPQMSGFLNMIDVKNGEKLLPSQDIKKIIPDAKVIDLTVY